MALAAGGRPSDGAALAWVALDDGDPQVHLARIDAQAKRTREVQLTTARGDASDLALAWAGDGWLVAWVDSRDGDGEVYTSKVDRDLYRVAPDERITHARGDASDVTLAADGAFAWLAWADPRESPREGKADIYAIRVGSRDARPAGEETRVLATAGHSRSPQIVPADQGALLGWVEDSPAGLDSPGSPTVATGVMLARLDANGRVVGEPRKIPLAAEGKATALALQTASDRVRAIVGRSSGDEKMTLDAVLVGTDGVVLGHPIPLLDLDAPGSFEVALALAADGLYFSDLGRTVDDHRIRSAAIAWGP
jgi:hypothetical protein